MSQIERALFEKLPEDQKQKRISELGEEGAIQQYGYELALGSMNKEGELIDFEGKESETYKKLQISAQNVLKSLAIQYDQERKRGQNLIIVTDEGVPPIVRQSYIEEAGKVVGKDLRVIVSETPKNLAEPFGEAIGQKIAMADKVILLTSKSRTHSTETREILAGISDDPRIAELQKLRQKNRGSMFSGKAAVFSITRANNIELLTGGAALENVEEMWERIDTFMEVFKDAMSADITTEKGTRLTIKIKPGTIDAESGKLDKPGNVANFPFGEVGSAPSFEGTDGVLVVDGVGGKAGATSNNGYIKEPIKMIIEHGEVIRMEGGTEADEFWQYLMERQSEYTSKHPDGRGSAFKLAEFGFGMNAAAWRIDTEGKKVLPPTQLEAEKALGTIHIAVGNNTLLLGLGGYGDEDPEYNPIDTVHSDQVIYAPTVNIRKQDGSLIKIMENGNMLI